MKTPALCALALFSFPSLLFSQQPPSPEPTLPVEREVTDTAGRKLTGTITAKSETGLKIRRTSDGKEFDIRFDMLSTCDRVWLGVDPPDALDSHRFPFPIRAKLPTADGSVGTLVVEPGEPVQLVTQNGKTLTVLIAGREFSLNLPEPGKEAVAASPPASHWNPKYPNITTKEFLETSTQKSPGVSDADGPFFNQVEACKKWHAARGQSYPAIIAITTFLRWERAEFIGKKLEKSLGTKDFENAVPPAPTDLQNESMIVGLRELNYNQRRYKGSAVTYAKYETACRTVLNLDAKAKIPSLSLMETARVCDHLLPHPQSDQTQVYVVEYSPRRFAPLFPFPQINETIIELVKTNIAKGTPMMMLKHIRWEKQPDGTSIGKIHTTTAVGVKSDGTMKNTWFECIDADGTSREYPAADTFEAGWLRILRYDPNEEKNRFGGLNLSYSTSPTKGGLEKSGIIKIGDVFKITTPNDGVALIQFTEFGPAEFTPTSTTASASYRWRYREKPTAEIQSGTDAIKESIKRIPLENRGIYAQPNSDHNVNIRAGNLLIRWETNWDYNNRKPLPLLEYYPSKGTLETLPAEDFDKAF